MNNKPILIVICDFIVLSMMTLIIGLDGPYQGVFSGDSQSKTPYATSELALLLENQSKELLAIQQQLVELRRTRQLTAEEQAKLDDVNNSLAEVLIKADSLAEQEKLTEETMGQKSAAELQQELLDLTREHAMLKVETNTNRSDLEFYQEKANISENALASSEKELATLREKSLKDAAELTEKERAMLASQANLLAAQKQLDLAQNELDSKLSALQNANAQLSKTSRELANYEDQLKKAQLDLSFANGKLSVTEKELAETRGQLDVTRQEVSDRELKLADSRKQVSSLQNVVKKAVTELSAAKSEIKDLRIKEQELGTTKEQVATLKGAISTNEVQLKTVKEQLAKAESDLRSNVYEHYANAVKKLDILVADRRALMDHVGKHVFYLPEVTIDNRNFLISELLSLTDMSVTNSPFDNVYDLQYIVSKTKDGDTLQTSSKAMFDSKIDPRVAMLEVAPSENALSIINTTELGKRGLHDLYLFSKSALGSESAALNTRASMDATSKEPYLFIRNNTSRSNSELKAQLGDFVTSTAKKKQELLCSQKNSL